MIRWIFGIVGALYFQSFWIGVCCYFIGSLIESLLKPAPKNTSYTQVNPQAFTHDLLIFTAAVMKADGHLYKMELNYVKDFLLRNLGPEKASDALHELKDILANEYDLQQVCRTFSRKTNSSERLLMLRFLFGLANSDGQITDDELSTIKYISDSCGIPYMHYESVKAMYLGGNFGGYNQGGYSNQRSSSSQSSYSYSNLDNDYKILEISPSATDDEVKKAYRRLAKEHHPDRVAHLGDEMRKAAEEKFTKLNQAYERIKDARGMK